MSRLRGFLHSIFRECLLQTRGAPPQRQECAAEFRVSLLPGLSGAVTCVGYSRTAPVLPSVPKLLPHLPIDSIPSLRPDTSRPPGDLPWLASCRRGSVDRPGTLLVR